MIIIDKKHITIGLAPMAGFTDMAFRQICREFGADLVYTELISARGLIEDNIRVGSWELGVGSRKTSIGLAQLASARRLGR